MNDDRKRELYEGMQAMQHNPCWQWFWSVLLQRREYLAQRVLQAADWSEYCELRGQLNALGTLVQQLLEIDENLLKRR